MEGDQAQQALARLAGIEQKVKQVQDKLETRLPNQRVHLAALMSGIKWRLECQRKREDCDEEAVLEAAKRVRMELGAFDYQTKEQAELLTRYLCELDDILSYGNAEVKDARKALVVHIQSLLAPADAMKTKSAKLKKLGERMLEAFLPPLTPTGTPTPETQAASTEAAEEEDTSAKSAPGQEATPSKASEKVDEKDQDMEGDEEEQGEDDEEDADADEAMDDEEEEEEEEQTPMPTTPTRNTTPQASVPMARSIPMEIDVNSLPVWRPYYQLQRRPDGIYLLAKLHDTDSRNVRVQWAEQSGVLRVSGFKLPTQKDLMVSRFSGAPTFGRFEIVERFPRNVLNMDQATQQLREDGTLEIRMPYYYVQSPLRVQRAWYQPRDCFVW